MAGLDGQVPGEMGLLLALSHLSLFNNNLVGQLPVQMMYLTDLKFMALESNALSGNVPDWIGGLTHMKFMALGGNKLTGTRICDLAFFNMKQLKILKYTNVDLTFTTHNFSILRRQAPFLVPSRP